MGSLSSPGLLDAEELEQRAARAHALRSQDGCHLCPRQCCADREHGAPGECGLEDEAVIAFAAPCFTEESCLTGRNGSGAIFFAGCNLRCESCRSADIAREPRVWRNVGSEELASFMLSLQARQVENLNLVTPTHVVPEILDALAIARRHGFRLPVVYNTSGYDRVAALEILDGVVDIYLSDFKFWDVETARKWAHAEDYPEVARAAIREMHRQVGDLVLDERGMATRGLLVRHLLLPGEVAGAREILRFLAEEVSPNVRLNLLTNYAPLLGFPGKEPFCRRPAMEEIREVRRYAEETGLGLVDFSGP